MAMSDDDRQAIESRLAPTGTAPVAVLAPVVDDGEELREIVVDAQGDVVAFTDQRALFVANGSGEAIAVGYDHVELRQRGAGLAVDVLLEGGRLVLDVARGTFARLAVVASGGPPGRASWLPVRTPPPRPIPEPPSMAVDPFDPVAPPPAPGGATYTGESAVRRPPPMPAAAGGVPAPAAGPAAAPQPTPPAAAPQAQAPAPSPVPAPLPPTASTLPALPPPGMPPAGWNPDPSGRHWWRWWDGIGWTDHVADGGAPYLDALPPR
jgi:hypothetical protein